MKQMRYWLAAAILSAVAIFGLVAATPTTPAASPAMFGDVSSFGQQRLLSTSTTASATWVTAAGRFQISTAGLVFSKSDWKNHLFSLGKLQGEGRQRGVEIVFFGQGADNATINYRLWRAKRGFNPFGNVFRSQPADIALDLVCSGQATLSTVVLSADETVTDTDYPILSADRIADTITCTLATTGTSPKGISGMLGTSGYGAPDPSAYSPANDTPAFLLVPDMGGGDLYLEIYVGTATNCNALVEAFE